MKMDNLTAIEKVHKCWNNKFPMWVKVLADERDRTSQTKVAKKIGYSPATVSQVISNQYKGNLKVIEIAVKGKLMNERLECPVLGSLDVKACRDHQKRPNTAVNNSVHARLYKACRNHCPHSEMEE